MLLLPLLKKEVHWSKRHVVVLAFLLVLLPGALGIATVGLQETVPEDVPVALVAQNDSVSEDDMGQARSGLGLYADPQEVSDRETAMEMLEREEVYIVVEVPPGVLDEDREQVQFNFTFHGAIAPLHQAETELVDLTEQRIGDTRQTVTGDRNVVVTTQIEGEKKGLGEFLYPALILLLLVFFAFTYIPHELRRDSSVFDRLRTETSLESIITSKLLYLTPLMVLPVLSFHAVALLPQVDYNVGTFDPVSLLASTALLLVTFLALATVAATIMVLSRFSAAGQTTNLLALLGVVGVSAMVFPRGAVSSLRATIAAFMPTHYAAVAVRSFMLKDVSVTTYLDMIGAVVLLLVVGALALKGSIVYYRRTI